MKKVALILLILGGTAWWIKGNAKPTAPEGETPEQKAARLKAEADKLAARTAYLKRLNTEVMGQFQTLGEYAGIPRGSYFGAVYVNDANGNKGVYYTENGNFLFIPISDIKIIKEPGIKTGTVDNGGVATTNTSGSGGGVMTVSGYKGRHSLFFN